MKKLLALPLLLTFICCTAARDRKIVNDFLSAQKEVQNGDSIYIHTTAVSEKSIVKIYSEVLAQKNSGKMTHYYYFPDTLSVWPFSDKEIKDLQGKSYPDHNWNLDYFDYTKTKPLNKENLKDRDFLVSYVVKGSRVVYAVSKPLVKGKTALLYFSSGVLLHGATKHGVFVLKKVKGKWQEVGVIDEVMYY